MCGTASFVDASSQTTLVQQAEAGGRTHAGSLFLTNFVGLDIFNPQESVPHRYFGFHAEALIQLHGHIEAIGKVLYILFKGKI